MLDGFKAASSGMTASACNRVPAESHVRSLADFEATCGVDFLGQTISAVGACGTRGAAVAFAADKNDGLALQAADIAEL